MPIERHTDGTVTVTGAEIQAVRVIAIRRGLILKIDTGMDLTRRSALTVARESGLTDKRTNRGALRDVNAFLSENGISPVWSKAHPNG